MSLQSHSPYDFDKARFNDYLDRLHLRFEGAGQQVNIGKVRERLVDAAKISSTRPIGLHGVALRQSS